MTVGRIYEHVTRCVTQQVAFENGLGVFETPGELDFYTSKHKDEILKSMNALDNETFLAYIDDAFECVTNAGE